MLTIFLLALAGIFLFALGYHLGYQMGTTDHIRKRLNRDRRQRARNDQTS